MKSILDPDFKYINAASTDIRDRLVANGMKPRERSYDELERLRRFRKQIEACAKFSKGKVTFDEVVFEELLAECDGANGQ